MISDFYQTRIVMKRKKRNQALSMNSGAMALTRTRRSPGEMKTCQGDEGGLHLRPRHSGGSCRNSRHPSGEVPKTIRLLHKAASSP